MLIPSRVEVLSWNENQVADLLREQKLLDCVDSVYQRHIDGQKLLHLKQGDVLHFLEIHNEKSRQKLWDVVRKITEKKGGIQGLMKNFQQPNSRKESEAEEQDGGGWDSEFSETDSDNYDEPEEVDAPPPARPEHPAAQISMERQQTIAKNLMGLLTPKTSDVTPSPRGSDSSYPDDIYDVPEDGCGEPEELYETPSDESGGGVVGRKSHAPVERQQSAQYIIPDNVQQHSEDEGDQEYEDLSGNSSSIPLQEEYVVPDVAQPPASVPPRPPKPSSAQRKPFTSAPSLEDSDEYIEPEGMENYEPPEPLRNNKKAVIDEPEVENYEPPTLQRETKKPGMEEPIVQEDYEIPANPEPTKESPPPQPKMNLPKKFGQNIFRRRSNREPPPTFPGLAAKRAPDIPRKPDNQRSPAEKSGTVENRTSRPNAAPSVQERNQIPPKPAPSFENRKLPSKPRPDNPEGHETKRAPNENPKSKMPVLPPRPPVSDLVDSRPSRSGSTPTVPADPPLPPRKQPAQPPQSTPSSKETNLSPPPTNGIPISARPPKKQESPSKSPHKTKEQILHEQPWFHGSITKEAISEALKRPKRDGAYLVRRSTRDAGKYIMSLSYKSDIRHLNIPYENGLYRLGDSGTVKFSTIIELVEHFKRNDIEFSAGGKTQLTHPCVRKN